MSKKIICESCESVFKEDAIGDAEICPVCGAYFDDEREREQKKKDAEAFENSLFYFNEILDFFKDPKEYCISAYCKECDTLNLFDLDQCEEVVDKDYVILKEGVSAICEKCGKEHPGRKIFYKRKNHSAPPLPRCPLCNSAMLEKISLGSKFAATVAFGAFAAPHNSKTYKCKSCGFKF